MRKPTEAPSANADLQAIQTSVAFKNISDAVEQYRRQFGLAFLALIAFSAVHVGLVVIANLYTLETRVTNGKLSAAADVSTRPLPVATAKAEQVSDLAYIMSNLEESEQRELLSNIDSIDFVDADGNYRKYTVTGFQLGGWKRGDLKLYTAVGHVLSYVRGKGLRVDEPADATSTAETAANGRRRLTTYSQQTYGATEFQSTVSAMDGLNPSAATLHSSDLCADQKFLQALNEMNSSATGGYLSASSTTAVIGTLAAGLEECYQSAVTGAYDMDSTTDASLIASGVQAYVVHYIDNLLGHINANNEAYTASAICAVDMFGTVQTNTYDDDGQGANIYSAQTCTLSDLTSAQYNLIGTGYFHGEEHPHAGVEAFDSMTHCLKTVVKGVLYEFSVLAGGSTDDAALSSWAGSTSVSAARISLAPAALGDGGRRRRLSQVAFSSFDLSTDCTASAYDLDDASFDASNQVITGVSLTDSSQLGAYFDKVFTHNLCYLGVTIPDLINLALTSGSGLFNALDDAEHAAWNGSTHTVTYNGVTYNLPDVTSSWSWTTGPKGTLGSKWTTLKSLIDTVVTKAISTVSQDITDCIGSNTGSFVAASKPLLEMAKTYLTGTDSADVTGMSKVVTYFADKAKAIEEEAYTFESEMADSAVLGCTKEAFKCFYIQFRADLQEQIRVEQEDALAQAKTTQIHATPVYAATGSFTTSFSLPAAPCVPKVLVDLEDHTGSFESFLKSIGDLSYSSYAPESNGTSRKLLTPSIENATNSFGDDTFERCEACLATVASGSKASAQFTYTDALSATMCSSISVLKSIYDDMVYQWGEYGVAYRESQELVYTAGVEEAQLYNQLQAEGWSSSDVTDGNKLMEKFVEDIVLVHIPETVSDMIDEYTSLQSTNLWKGFKEVNLTDVNFQSASYSFILPYSTGASTTGGYGCSGEDYKNLTNHNTELTIMGIDACGVSVEDQYRKPFISGAGFSSILGTYDQFSMYLSSRFCRMVVTMSTSTTGDSSGAVTAASSAEVEALIMLHGFGGDSGFLHLSAATAYFMDAGIPRFGNPDQWTAGQDDSGVTYLYPLAKEPTGTPMCSDDWAAASGCTALMAPGGFLILAPDVSACPVSLRTWYLNSEFTGFIMDYVLFDLQMYIASQLLIPMTNSGIFGFSMGGFGTMNILAAYPYMATSAASFNAPVYPGGCFFFANCHQECALDIVLCELEFTTLGMVVNSYVLIFADTTVVSMGSMDPISVGVAAHLLAKKVQNTYADGGSGGTTAALRCGMYQATSGSEEVWGYYSVSSLPSGGTCSWQDWSSTMSCDSLLSSNSYSFLKLDNFANSAPTSPSSIKLTFAKYASGAFAASSATQFTCSSCSVSFGADDINHNLPDNHNVVLCPEVVCDDNKWCAETNMSEGADHYLNPLYAMIAAAKFVPASKPQSGQFASLQQVGVPVSSAYVTFSLNSPLMKFNYNNDMYATYPMLLFMHCSQNDEYDLFTPHANYVELLMSTFFVSMRKRVLLAPETTSENFNAKSVFTIDFYDCDWHRFSEKDMHKAMLFFSDAFRTYPVSFWVPAVMSTALASSDYSTNFGFCFLTKYSYVPSYSSHESTPCPTRWSASPKGPDSAVFWPSKATTLSAGSETVQGTTSSCDGSCTGHRASPHPPLMMKVSDWDIAHSFNEVECDITTLMRLIEELDDLNDSQQNCRIASIAGTSHDFTRWNPSHGDSPTVCSSTEFAGGLSMSTCETKCTELNACYDNPGSSGCSETEMEDLDKLTSVDCVTLFPSFWCYYSTDGPTAFA